MLSTDTVALQFMDLICFIILEMMTTFVSVGKMAMVMFVTWCGVGEQKQEYVECFWRTEFFGNRYSWTKILLYSALLVNSKKLLCYFKSVSVTHLFYLRYISVCLPPYFHIESFSLSKLHLHLPVYLMSAV